MKLDKKKLRKHLENKEVKLTNKELKELKYNSTVNAVDQIRVIPAYVLRDEFGFGEKRINQFFEAMSIVLQDIEDDWIKLDDMRQVLLEEVNIDLTKDKEEIEGK